MGRNFRLPRLSLLLGAVALLTMAGWLALAGPAQGAPNSVQIQPASAAVSAGGTATVSLVAEMPAGAILSQWEINVTYNNSLLAATACVSHPDDVCNKDFSPDTVQSSGAPLEDLTGQLTLADITFQATGPAGQCSPLDVQVVTFVDSEDIETNPTVSDGEICIQGTPAPTAEPTATPTPGPTGAPTPTPTPGPTPTPEAMPCSQLADFDPENFSDPTNIDNPWFSLIPGRKLVLKGVANGLPRRVVFTATDLTKEINGVRTLVMWDRDFEGDQLLEEELAFFAQDDAGNVWNLGEYPEEFENGEFVGAPSTWLAGEASAEAGIHMLENPRVGEPRYLQGWAPEIDFLDCAEVVGIVDEICVPFQCYEDVLVTDENSPLDTAGGHQRKFHALGVGIVDITAVEDPEGETISLTKNEFLGASEMEWARGEALRLEERAYEISDVYRDSAPMEPLSDTPIPEPTPEPTPEPEPTAAPSTPAPAVVSTPAPRPIPTVLAAAQPPQRSARAGRLPSGGGPAAPFESAGSVGWMLPLGLGLLLLGAHGRGYLRSGVVQEPDAETLALRRMVRLSPSEMAWLRRNVEEGTNRLGDAYRDKPSTKRRLRDD